MGRRCGRLNETGLPTIVYTSFTSEFFSNTLILPTEHEGGNSIFNIWVSPGDQDLLSTRCSSRLDGVDSMSLLGSDLDSGVCWTSLYLLGSVLVGWGSNFEDSIYF